MELSQAYTQEGRRTRPNQSKSKDILPKPHRAMFTDIAVVGAGLSGLSAALSAAEQGANVTLIDKLDHLGGNNKDLLAEELVRQIITKNSITIITGSPAFGIFHPI